MTDPHDTPYTVVSQPGAGQPRFDSPGFSGWPGPTEPVDSHDVGYEIINEPMRTDGPVPDNIHGD